MEKVKTIADQLIDVSEEFCKTRCKYCETINSVPDDEADELIHKYCTDCPINKLV